MEPQGASRRILVIDDEDDIREVTHASLTLMGGLDVMTASSSLEGLALAEQEQPDAILLDVMMPDMDGQAVFKKLQENPATANIPVIFLTAKVQPKDKQRLAGLAVKAVIAKPFDPILLVDQVMRALGWS